MAYSNSIFLANVEHIRKQRGLKVGQVETAAEVSTGYLARLSKNPNTMPGAEVLINLALYFGVSIDSLLLCDLSSLSEEEEMLSKYLQKIRNATAHGVINWQVESKLMSTKRVLWNGSFAHKNEVYTNGAIYIATLSDGSVTKIVPINGIDFANERFGGFELYVKEAGSEKFFPICATDMLSDILRMDLRNLYMLIISSESQFTIDEGAKNYMLRFLAQDNSVERRL